MENMEEISLREIIEILLQRKWLIIGITFIAVLVSGLVSFFVLTPVYEARAVIRIEEPSLPYGMVTSVALAEEEEFDEEGLFYQPSAEDLREPPFLEELIQTLGLEKEDITPVSLREAITIDEENDRLYEIKVRAEDSQRAKEIADFLIGNGEDYLETEAGKKYLERIEEASDYLLKQISLLEEHLEMALAEEVEEQFHESMHPEVLSWEIELWVEAITEQKIELVRLRLELQEASGGKAEELQHEISLGEDSLLEYEEELQKVLMAQERMEREVEQQQTAIAGLERQHHNLQLMANLEPQKTRFEVLSPATVSDDPVEPRRGLNMAVAGVLGLMLGGFIAFFQHYWQKSDPRREE